MIEGLVTVVIPIYKVEKYLNRCIESVVNQTYKNIEIILVDDGSPDNCPIICDKWAKTDSRIKVIHKGNAGLGMARNSGIEVSEGEYICFFDSDDYVEPELIEKVYSAAKENNAQSVIFGYKCIDIHGKVRKTNIPVGTQYIFEGKDVRNILLLDMIDSLPDENRIKNISMSAWSKLYSMCLINRTKWRFCSEREYSCEDLYSHLEWYAYVDKAVVFPVALYNYCDNETSLTKSYRMTAPYESQICYEAMVNICKKNSYDQKLIERLGLWYFGSIVGISKSLVNSKLRKQDKNIEIKKILDSEHFSQIMAITDFKKENIKRKILYWIVKRHKYKCFYWILYIQAKCKGCSIKRKE